MTLNETPSANRLHIGIFGRRNSGKSSLINAITGQKTALTSEIAGTTTDPVYKAMEIHGLGPCVLIDTAGFDDTGALGELRVERTREALKKTDLALLVLDQTGDLQLEREWLDALRGARVPVLAVLNKADLPGRAQAAEDVERALGLRPLLVSARKGEGLPALIAALARSLPEDWARQSIAGALVKPGDIALLVMPQDIQAPKGRLILPQVQTIRDLLDHRCLVLSTTVDQIDQALAALKAPPSLIITDSQVFAQVYQKKPPQSRLTSFSVLMAAVKGDIQAFVAGAAAIDRLRPGDGVLIAEACTHAPLAEDIGREKIPRLLRQRAGGDLRVDVASGVDFPEDLSPYRLVIHCGACMFNRKYVLSRIAQCAAQNVPITNYGVALAHLSGILDAISYA